MKTWPTLLNEGSLSFGKDDFDPNGHIPPMPIEEMSNQEIYDALPHLPSLEHNGNRFVALPHREEVGTFNVYPIHLPYVITTEEERVLIYTVKKIDTLNGDHIVELDQLIIDTDKTEDFLFILKLTLLSVEKSYRSLYNHNDYLAYLTTWGCDGPRLNKRTELFRNAVSRLAKATEPLRVALDKKGVDQFQKVLKSKVQSWTQSDEEEIDQKITVTLERRAKELSIRVVADWFHELSDAILKSVEHMGDHVVYGTHRSTVDSLLKGFSSDSLLLSKLNELKELPHCFDTDTEPYESLAVTHKAELILDTRRLNHWGLTPDKVKSVLSQQGNSYIFDTAKFLIKRYTGDPHLYESKTLTIPRGYKGFSEMLGEEYEQNMNESRVKEALMWWDALAIYQQLPSSGNVPPARFFAVEGRAQLNEMYIHYLKGITQPISDRLVPILDHPLGKKRSRLVFNKLGLGLASLLVEKSDTYLSNGGEGVPFGKEDISYLQNIIGASRPRYVMRALEEFEDYQAIKLENGFLKLGAKNQESESVILEGARRSQRARERRRRRTNKK